VCACSSLERVLYVWALRHPASGYVQGLNDLCSVFYAVFLSPWAGERAWGNTRLLLCTLGGSALVAALDRCCLASALPV